MSIIYKSLRIGQYGKVFTLYKIRTMVVGADKIGSPSTSADDKRLTSIGKLLRKFKLDELPQVWNIIKGDMALVGPRPTVKEVIDTLKPEEKKTILSVKPGITGLGSLYDFSEEERLKGAEDPHKKFLEEIYPEIIKREIWYIKHKSLWLNLKIILLTFLKIFVKS